MDKINAKTVIIQNGTLIDGSGNPAASNQAVVIQGNRILSVGPVPPEVNLEDRENVQVIDATGQWVMPGLIDGHCHLSFGQPAMPGITTARGTTSAEFSTLRAARNAQTVLRHGITSLSVPGGTWFIDVALRDAISAGMIEGPRICCAGRFIVTYGSIADNEPSWVGTPEHVNGVLCNTVTEMITEVRRQCKHGVNFIKMADSTWGDTQTISTEELTAVVQEAHRRNARVTIHSRGANSTRAAAEAGVDWILHADMATEADLDAVAEAGVRIMPTMTFLRQAVEFGREFGRSDREVDAIKRHFDGAAGVLERARSLGIKVLCGTDSGNSPVMPYGELHADEPEIMVRYGGYTPMEAIVACTRDNAFAVGLEGQVGEIRPGMLADIIILSQDPIANIGVLKGGHNLVRVIKDGKTVDLNGHQAEDALLEFQETALV
ncbi:MAG: amidohydrolase family protein [Chloroflexi bacterium]|nr:amidohydrolase family protein [Chloroflexota bacterium]